ncbi:rhodanese-like domain-containing protein [Eremococcus coleocola]|uniref:rhodanese-like domain-containing protein n=1 Tax=Eremococcus coleocola TaxID=88132 RepID=UPI000422F908|nr:rhodanese-like domain-containing protein [Eremococcus coleocola]
MYPTISISEFLSRAEKSALNLLDVRGPQGFAASHLPQAQSKPYADILTWSKDLDSNQDYYVICAIGQTSAKACDFLASQGFKVTNVEGGMAALDSSSDLG